MGRKILIVEDEQKIARFIEMELNYEGYATEKAADGRTGLELAETGGFDLILLDLMLPGMSGMEVLRRIRRSFDVPVIVLTARDSTMDKVSGLDGGADDYITKPFATEELLARIRSALRKSSPAESEQLSAFGVVLDPARRKVTVNGNSVPLTKREFDLLCYLMKNKGVVLSREVLLENVWGYEYEGETNAVDVFVRFLRSKIDDVYGIRLISTVRGVGYVIKDEE
ncbi:response regulator transcription factor [Caproicibacter fermentans]|uniref:Stage 0 sporulation protein A homolog n=1 Tax=Caproicibacter fermentans TaxID=2576756 RepID=A0A7G8TE55_9FIRM|nr:response regulator transcription factor [Caproicibacter fermentans]QNK41896.1 response regulator transcription factor [Caproicibacter fermentans]